MIQITIFDILEKKVPDVPCGYIDDVEKIGRVLKFQELREMIGKKCIISGNIKKGYRVVRILEYIPNCDRIYKRTKPLPNGCIEYPERVNEYIHDVVGQKSAMECYEIECNCDRIGYSENDRNKKSSCWLSEMNCKNGRYEPINEEYAEIFYELKGDDKNE